ncbi:transcriptional regulator, GntR family [Roseomonas rosea]|jgi:DNA-binding GntR family transcriptional regulator|uniref:Transcriptional regulator, GntR family n=1 Tax=Muricoccus roseus TaxID=198092 RepID=A0A1M6ALP0_9PROT|nr:GntR family transcriptional regulator [Roseomonas rosea]SHI37429.1 transcriptional regulator, GntR family [Roseomonas rosea]
MTSSSAQGAGFSTGFEQAALPLAEGDTLASALHRRLEAEIADGALEPGSRLDEQEIAQRFGVSRTPVREAFRLLAADRLVELRGRQGALVRSIGVHTLIEMFQVMGELEGLCARLAARRIAPRGIERLRALHARLQASAGEGPDRFYDVNQEFHEAIYEASCNAFLAEETRKLRNRVAAYRRRVTRMPNRVEDTIREHEEVMEAIIGRDPERAHAAMRAHLTLLGDNLLDFIAAFE